MNVPEADTVIDDVVAPLLQRYASGVPPVVCAVSVRLSPSQKEAVPFRETVGFVKLVVVTVIELDVLRHPLPSITVTLYVPAWRTVMRGVVSPVLHVYEAKPSVAASVTVPPTQRLVGPLGVIVTLGRAFTAIVRVDVPTQPVVVFVSVTVIVPLPAAVHVTLTVLVFVAPTNEPPVTPLH